MVTIKKELKDMNQIRADFAWQCVNEAALDLGANAKEFKAYVKKLPMLIKTNGLGGALAFVYSKKKDKGKEKAYMLIYDYLQIWCREYTPVKWNADLAQKELMDAVIQLKSDHYRAAANEILSLMNWMRRFAEGKIQGEA
jgi:CRISPR-associated protein Cmr5